MAWSMPPPARAARVIALDAVTGELLWVHGEKEGARGAAAPRQLSGRGPVYWSDGKEARILYVTPGYRLIALDAKTGQRVASFGDNGAVDLKADRRPEDRARPDHRRDRLAVGAHRGGRQGAGGLGLPRRLHADQLSSNNKGSARAYDVRTGKKLWEFHTIPQKGEPGYETWLNNSADYTGNTGVWTEMTADPVGQPGLSAGRISPPPTSMAASVRATVFMATAWWRWISTPAR